MRWLELESDPPLPITVDGNRHKATAVRVELKPTLLPVLIPKRDLTLAGSKPK